MNEFIILLMMKPVVREYGLGTFSEIGYFLAVIQENIYMLRHFGEHD